LSPPDPIDPLSAGLQWASRITTLSLSFALPAVLGYYIDRWLGSSPIGVLLGVVLGFAAGMIQLLQIARGAPKR